MDGTFKAEEPEVEGTETGGGGKEGYVSFDESKDLEALPSTVTFKWCLKERVGDKKKPRSLIR